jgi:hypothetical protein
MMGTLLVRDLGLDLQGLARAIRRDDQDVEEEICQKMEVLIKQMHNGFGGELWQGEELMLWKDGVQRGQLPLREITGRDLFAEDS